MNPRFQAALKREAQKIPPIWLMRQAGRYHRHYQGLRAKHSFVDLCKKPELAAETALGPILDFDFDTAILFSDILFPLEALGMGLSYDDGPPKLGFSLDEETFPRLKHWNDACPALAFQGEAMQATRALLPADKSLVGFVGGPWTLFVYAVEGSHKGSLVKSKQLLPSLFPRFAESLLPLLAYTIGRQLAAGAEAVMIFDTAAGELSPEFYARYSLPFLAALARLHPGKLGYYGKGMSEAQLALLKQSHAPFAGLGLDHRHGLAKILPLTETGFLQGNFDQSLLHLDGKAFESALRDYLAPFQALSVNERRGWVAGLGHGVLPATPERNVKRYVELVREAFA
ncbi:MAG TPA: uroporphyrinogen decarboxylase family protein [Bdellovibrionota bacterium]|jgi:uroporphyrinogen decarboxylase